MENLYSDFGNKVKSYRIKKGESLSQASKSFGLTKSYLSKIENGHIKPSEALIVKISNYLSLSEEELSELLKLVGLTGEGTGLSGGGILINQQEDQRKEGLNRVDKNITENTAEVTVPSNTPVLYTDSIFVTKNEFGVVLDFAQRLGPTKKHTVVARVGMSERHAEALLDVLGKKLNNTQSVIMKKVATS